MSRNMQTVQEYMHAFSMGDHAAILACLTEDVVWVMPGAFYLTGKDAFGREVRNPAFVGNPTIAVTRTVEEGNVVVAEGTVRCNKTDGGVLNAVFCDVFIFTDTRIRHLTSYLMEVSEVASQ
jgi:uncharacterized protein